jgi:hypothetical protein
MKSNEQHFNTMRCGVSDAVILEPEAAGKVLLLELNVCGPCACP